MNFLQSQELLLVLTFASVVLVIEGCYYYYKDVYEPRTRIGKRLEQMQGEARIQEAKENLRRRESKPDETLFLRLQNRLDLKITQAGLKNTSERFLTYMAAGSVGLVLALPLIMGFANLLGSLAVLMMVFGIALALGVMLPLMWLDRMASKRLKQFETQFPVALDVFVRGLRAGHPVSSALNLLVEEMPDPISAEFAMVVAEISYGHDMREALDNLAQRVQTSDIKMFAVCVGIQAETGGNLSDILEGLATVIRERQSMVLKVRALASEGKMTAYVLTALPVGTFLSVFLPNPSFYLDVADDPIFLPGAMFLAVWFTIGLYLIRKFIDLKV